MTMLQCVCVFVCEEVGRCELCLFRSKHSQIPGLQYPWFIAI